MADENWTREYEDGDTVPGTPYKVLTLLGAGGMGSVYIVEHVELGRRYVLKSLLQTLATRRDLIARMRNEWRSLGKLRHPHIVDVLNAGATPDRSREPKRVDEIVLELGCTRRPSGAAWREVRTEIVQIILQARPGSEKRSSPPATAQTDNGTHSGRVRQVAVRDRKSVV